MITEAPAPMGAESPEAPAPMDASRLEVVALYLFPKARRTWKSEVARTMGVHVTTVRRWCAANEVPAGYDKALECLAARKSDLLAAKERELAEADAKR